MVLAGPAFAGIVRSPDVAHVEVFDRIIEHELRWVPSERALLASVTFSNVDFVSRVEARRDKRCDFYLPGVRFDARSGIFYDRDGVAVAALRKRFIGSEIHLLPGAKIWIADRSGTVRLTLAATEAPQEGLRWVQTDQAELLPNRFG